MIRPLDALLRPCDRCGKERMFSETHAAQGDMLIRDIIARMRHLAQLVLRLPAVPVVAKDTAIINTRDMEIGYG